MKEEVVIINRESDWVFKHPTEALKEGRLDLNAEFHEQLKKGLKTAPLKGEPQYLAIHVKGKGAIYAMLEIDYKNSKLDEGEIVPQGEPIHVYIPIKSYTGNRLEKIRYTSFRKLITHKTSTDL